MGELAGPTWYRNLNAIERPQFAPGEPVLGTVTVETDIDGPGGHSGRPRMTCRLLAPRTIGLIAASVASPNSVERRS